MIRESRGIMQHGITWKAGVNIDYENSMVTRASIKKIESGELIARFVRTN